MKRERERHARDWPESINKNKKCRKTHINNVSIYIYSTYFYLCVSPLFSIRLTPLRTRPTIFVFSHRTETKAVWTRFVLWSRSSRQTNIYVVYTRILCLGKSKTIEYKTMLKKKTYTQRPISTQEIPPARSLFRTTLLTTTITRCLTDTLKTRYSRARLAAIN